MSYFKIDKISYSYDVIDKSKKALSDVSFSVEKGEFVAIVGKTGSGKSTLVSLLNGLNKATEGTIYFNDKNIYDKDFDLHGLRFKCGVVFQYPEYQLFSETVMEDICFGAIKKGMSKKEAEDKAKIVMEMLHIYDLKDETPFVLSGGEKRKVAFAGVLVTEPEVLILDEPEAGLDTVSKGELFKFLTYLNKEKNVTIIFVTHNLDDAVEYANRVIVLNEGKLIADASPYKVFSDDSVIKTCNLSKPHGVVIAEKLKSKGIDIDTDKIRFDDIVSYMSKL